MRLVHRPGTDTPLTNGQRGQRLVAISSELARLLEDHVQARRGAVTDERGRKPVSSTEQIRMATTTFRRLIYEVTSPCFRDDPCPDCRESISGEVWRGRESTLDPMRQLHALHLERRARRRREWPDNRASEDDRALLRRTVGGGDGRTAAGAPRTIRNWLAVGSVPPGKLHYQYYQYYQYYQKYQKYQSLLLIRHDPSVNA